MRDTTTPRPSGQERTFLPHETIVSKTDLQGRIRYVNDVFVRVSAYPEAELLGKPQNVIRHPEMPAAGFKILWDQIQQGQEAFSFIVNLAKDGLHYWVLAHITPSYDDRGAVVGYHSTRRTVPASIVEYLTPIYAKVRAVERAAGGGRRAAEAGEQAIAEMLAGKGLTYDEWIWSIAEVYATGSRQPTRGAAPLESRAA